MVAPQIEESWLELLQEDFQCESFQKLKAFLVHEREQHQVFPPGGLIFEAFNRTPVPKVRAVIIGQDPYHGPGQAHGLCFSVPEGITIPPSLRNMFKELQQDVDIYPPKTGNLGKWADQGVLMLNATLTVRARQAGSHQKKGWEEFTDAAIKKLSENREDLVFMLWGSFAQSKQNLIAKNRDHLILKAPHPSPLSAHRGFFGCHHFSQCNAFLEENGRDPIDWQPETQ